MPESCVDILKHGKMTEILTSNKRLSEQLSEWARTATWEQYKSAQDSGFKIGLPVEGVPISIGKEETQENFSNWQTSVAEGRSRNYTFSEAVSVVRQMLPADVVQAYNRCLSAQRQPREAGLFAYLYSELPGENDTFEVAVQYIKAANENWPKVRNITLSGCDFVDRPTLNVGEEITNARKILPLRRQGEERVVVLVDTESVDATLRIGKIKKIELPGPCHVVGDFVSSDGPLFKFLWAGGNTIRVQATDDNVLLGETEGERNGDQIEFNLQVGFVGRGPIRLPVIRTYKLAVLDNCTKLKGTCMSLFEGAMPERDVEMFKLTQ